MPRAAKKYNNDYNYGYTRPFPTLVASPTKPITSPQTRPIKRVVKKRTNPILKFFSSIFAILFAGILGIYVLPYGFERISSPLIFGHKYKEVQLDYHELFTPTSNYLYNDVFGSQRNLFKAETKKPLMANLYLSQNMPVLEVNLRKLMKQYPTIQPSVFAWDFENGKYVDIDASKIYSAASIIKIPVLIQLFKSIEANQLTIYDEMPLTPYYKADGSGNIKNRMSGEKFTIDELAKVMIQKSDNSATNMLMSVTGGMTDVNAGMRQWGIQHTQINNWLPDLAGTNYTTAKDLARMLYNLDNPGFLNLNSREYIIDYMSHVENNRLIHAGLGSGALFVHKTGDIGKMLGDAGIVFAPNGKKYIVVILANRPYNSPKGKDFIQKASSLIYNSITSGGY